MAKTSKNNIYYNDDENSIADVLSDMKKLAESADDAIEKSKYNDTEIKQKIENVNAEQNVLIKQLQEENKELKNQIPSRTSKWKQYTYRR